MEIAGSDVSNNPAVVIFQDDNFASTVTGMEEGVVYCFNFGFIIHT